MKVFLFIVVFLLSMSAMAEFSFFGLKFPEGPKGEKEKVHYMAIHRLYLGGMDEEDLKVQAELYNPYSTVNLKKIQKSVLEADNDLEN